MHAFKELPNEEKLLLLCLNPVAGKKQLSSMNELISRGIDWNKFWLKSNLTLLFPLIKSNLVKSRNPMIPGKLIEEFTELSDYSVSQSILIKKELISLMKELDARGIEAILLKGNAFAELIHGKKPYKLVRDIDLLVKKEDLANAVDALVGLGYNYSGRNRIQYSETFSHQFEPLFKKCNNFFISVELHRSIAAPLGDFKINEKIFWSNARKIKLKGFNAIIPCNEHLIIHSCIHCSFMNAFSNFLPTVFELNQLISTKKIDWKRLSGKSREWNVSAFVYAVLYPTKELFNNSIPEKFLIELKNNSNERELNLLNKLGERRIFNPHGNEFMLSLELILLQINFMKGNVKKLRLLFLWAVKTLNRIKKRL